ncbi:unnamed protein product [Polarella glacialis]|uniref:Uncharacterized protein n=1 Tax=Polarella glacialis TaxID=89957 RepID=A0A813FSX9_POLGL|nr:unnamed protein product [Polarella glacialis]CAE8615596.1 unnamed protein product [Polarella glacialis]CAE8685311.1 unnamed protein product [Polarella glacialis]
MSVEPAPGTWFVEGQGNKAKDFSERGRRPAAERRTRAKKGKPTTMSRANTKETDEEEEESGECQHSIDFIKGDLGLGGSIFLWGAPPGLGFSQHPLADWPSSRWASEPEPEDPKGARGRRAQRRSEDANAEIIRPPPGLEPPPGCPAPLPAALRRKLLMMLPSASQGAEVAVSSNFAAEDGGASSSSDNTWAAVWAVQASVEAAEAEATSRREWLQPAAPVRALPVYSKKAAKVRDSSSRLSALCIDARSSQGGGRTC